MKYAWRLFLIHSKVTLNNQQQRNFLQILQYFFFPEMKRPKTIFNFYKSALKKPVKLNGFISFHSQLFSIRSESLVIFLFCKKSKSFIFLTNVSFLELTHIFSLSSRQKESDDFFVIESVKKLKIKFHFCKIHSFILGTAVIGIIVLIAI